MTFLHTLYHNCRTLADKPALRVVPDDSPAETVTYAALEAVVQQTQAFLLGLGVKPGDRVALQLPKGLPFIYLHLATLRLGAISLPLNPAYPPHELAYFLEDAAVRFFVADVDAQIKVEGLRPDLPELEQVVYLAGDSAASLTAQLPANPDPASLPAIPDDPDCVALMIYTSGTTGRPKGALITHGNLTANISALHSAWGWRVDDILLHVLPLFHVHGLVVALHGALHAGATTILLPKFEPRQTLELLTSERCTVFMAVPTIHRRLVDFPGAAGYDLSHMRLLTSGSDRLPDDVFTRFQTTFGHTLLERYGMTETGMNLSNPLHGERRIGSVGLPLPGVEARIVDPVSGALMPDGEVGEVQIRGPHVCQGYWRQPDKTRAAFTADGWLHTGDLGLREPDGYFTLKGRAKDLIITGGYNVYPPEVELVLAGHPAVAASAVIGCPDPEWGEQVTAVVVAKEGASLDAADLLAFCRARLAPYKTPRRIVVAPTLPRNALGKVEKARLRDALCADA